MKRRTSHGQASRSIFGRSRVTQREAPGELRSARAFTVGWPAWIALLLLYYSANFMVLGALFLGIGGQASNIREIQTISMPVVLLQLMVLLLAMNVIGSERTALDWIAYIVPFSSPTAMIAHAAQFEALWPHLLALAWQTLWVVVIIRASSRLFRRTVLKSTPSESFFSLGFLRRRRSS